MKAIKIKNEKLAKRIRRHKRIRTQISGTSLRPRLVVFRSNKFVYAQLIDDVTATTLASASDIKVAKGTKMERAKTVGSEIASTAKKMGITTVVFDRGGFLYTGRVQALADAAREAGLTF
ncbi:MAG: large subunit ribosomal protein L18 [Planctomycetota bacterium]|jgi:large subunit ribosomal protein L18